MAKEIMLTNNNSLQAKHYVSF